MLVVCLCDSEQNQKKRNNGGISYSFRGEGGTTNECGCGVSKTNLLTKLQPLPPKGLRANVVRRPNASNQEKRRRKNDGKEEKERKERRNKVL